MIAAPRLSALLAAVLLLTPAPSEEVTEIVVQVQGARNLKGLLRISLFQQPEGFPERSELAARTASLELSEGVIEARFDDLAPGEWAVAVLHDENENGRLDRNFPGIPKEGVGTSNDAVRFGLPSFEKARFAVPPEGASMTVKLRYWM